MIRGVGGFLFLLSHELRLTFRAGSGDPQRKGRMAVLAIMAVALLGVGHFVAKLLAQFDPQTYDPAFLFAATFMIGAMATLMFGHALIAVTDAIYTRGDLDLLLSSPFSPWTVLVVRALAVFLRVGGTYFILVSGVAAWLIVFGAWRWLSPLGGLIGLAFATTALGILAAMGLFATIGARATRIAAQVLGALVGASVFLFFQLQNLQYQSQDGNSTERWERTAAWIQGLSLPVDNPLFLPARAFLGDPQALAIWTGACLTLFVFATLWFSGGFVRDAAAANSAAPKRRARDRAVRRMRGGVTPTIVRKELRLIFRDTVLLSQVLLQLIYLVPLAVALANSSLRGEATMLYIGIVSGAFAALAASIAGALAWIVISAEDAPDLIAAAPVAKGAMERGKVAAATLPVALLGLFAAAFIWRVSPASAGWALTGVVASALSAALIGVWHQQPGSRKDFRRRPRTSWPAMIGQGFVGMSWSAATGFAAGGLPVVSIVPVIIAVGVMLALHESRRTAIVPVKPKAAKA